MLKIKEIIKNIHKKDNELTERYLGNSLFCSGFWARKGLRAHIKTASLNGIKGAILDVGCGNKPYEKYFTKNVSLYIGIDYSSVSGYLGNKADVYGDVRKLPFKDKSFDVILCFEVLEHIDETDMLINEFRRALKKEGRLLVSSPFMFPVHSNGVDYFRFTAKGLEYVIMKNNFKIINTVSIAGSGCALAVLLNTYIYYGCFFWNKFLYPVSIIIRPALWLLMLAINISGWVLDRIFKVDFMPFGHLVIAESC